MAKKSYLLIAFLAVSPFSFGASFDCAKAGTAVEKLICKDETLSKLDEQLASSYKQALADASDKDAFKHQQIDWLKTRNVCTDTTCLIESYRKRISAFGQGEKLAASSESKKELTFTLVKGEENEVCHSYIKMLRETHYESISSFACGQRILPDFNDFSEIGWTELTDKKEIERTLKDNIRLYLAFSRKLTEEKFSAEWYGWNKIISDKNFKIFYSNIDFGSDGVGDVIYKITFDYEGAGKYDQCSRNTLFYIKDSAFTVDNAGNFYPGPYFPFTFGQNYTYKFENKLYVTNWLGNTISDGSNVDVYGVGNKKLCGILVK